MGHDTGDTGERITTRRTERSARLRAAAQRARASTARAGLARSDTPAPRTTGLQNANSTHQQSAAASREHHRAHGPIA